MEKIEVLLSHRGDPPLDRDATDGADKTALDIAREKGMDIVVDMLEIRARSVEVRLACSYASVCVLFILYAFVASVQVPFVGEERPVVALLIGNSNYRHAANVLETPAKDVDTLASLFRDLGVPCSRVSAVRDPTYAELTEAVENVVTELGELDDPVVFVHYSGHGSMVESSGQLLMEMVDDVSACCLDGSVVGPLVKAVKNRRGAVIVTFDACRR